MARRKNVTPISEYIEKSTTRGIAQSADEREEVKRRKVMGRVAIGALMGRAISMEDVKKL
jgi:hypothetical protein